MPEAYWKKEIVGLCDASLGPCYGSLINNNLKQNTSFPQWNPLAFPSGIHLPFPKIILNFILPIRCQYHKHDWPRIVEIQPTKKAIINGRVYIVVLKTKY